MLKTDEDPGQWILMFDFVKYRIMMPAILCIPNVGLQPEKSTTNASKNNTRQLPILIEVATSKQIITIININIINIFNGCSFYVALS